MQNISFFFENFIKSFFGLVKYWSIKNWSIKIFGLLNICHMQSLSDFCFFFKFFKKNFMNYFHLNLSIKIQKQSEEFETIFQYG